MGRCKERYGGVLSEEGVDDGYIGRALSLPISDLGGLSNFLILIKSIPDWLYETHYVKKLDHGKT